MALGSSCHSRRWRERNPEKVRDYKLRIRFGITAQEFDDLLAAQGGACAICLTTTPGGRGTWHVDHDHLTGRVRGLLCFRCNTCLEWFELLGPMAQGYLCR